jgi:DME family drug/metabolite transporter
VPLHGGSPADPPAHHEATGQTRGVLEMAVAAVSIGTLGPLAGLAYETGLTPTVFTALRAALGAVILGTIVAIGWQPHTRLRSLPARERTMLAVAVVMNGLQNLALFIAYGEMSVALVLILFYLNPALVAVASAALGRERLTRLRVGALACAGFGLTLVLGSQVGPDATATPLGVALACFAAVCHATYYLVVRDGFPHVPAVQATSVVLAGGFVIAGSAALIAMGSDVGGSWVGSPTAWLIVLLAATMGAAFPKVLIIRSVRTIGAPRASLVALIEPVTGVVMAAIVLGQTLSAAEVLGGAAILVAAAVVQRPDRSAARGAAPTIVEPNAELEPLPIE